MGPDEQAEASEMREWGRWTKKPQEQAAVSGEIIEIQEEKFSKNMGIGVRPFQIWADNPLEPQSPHQ